jgi:hypothetical protein
MGEFQNREEAFEGRYALDQELAFRAIARRNRLLGLWVADLLGKTGDEATAHAARLVDEQTGRPNDEALFETIKADLTRAGVERSDHRIRRQMDELLAQAKAEIAQGR